MATTDGNEARLKPLDLYEEKEKEKEEEERSGSEKETERQAQKGGKQKTPPTTSPQAVAAIASDRQSPAWLAMAGPGPEPCITLGVGGVLHPNKDNKGPTP